MKRNIPYVYCICRIDTKYWQNIDRDLENRGYKQIKSCIPTVNILEKSKAGKNIYKEVPMLFNYGFIRVKSNKAFDRQFLTKLKRDIPGILSFMKSLENMHPKKKRLRIDNSEDFDDFSMVATISRKEIKRYKAIAKRNKIFSSNDIVNTPIGSYITLKGYPFEGINARVDEINLNTKMVGVTIFPNTENSCLVIQVPFDNVFYSVYQNYNEDILNSPDREIDISQIAEGAPDEFLISKQY